MASMASSVSHRTQRTPTSSRVRPAEDYAAPSPALVLQRAAAAYQAARSRPRALTPSAILALQRTIGNQATNRLLQQLGNPADRSLDQPLTHVPRPADPAPIPSTHQGGEAIQSRASHHAAPHETPVPIQRAIAIGMQRLPRTSSMSSTNLAFLNKEGLADEFRRLNDDRDNIYIFSSDDHFLKYLRMEAGKLPPGSADPPLVHKVPSTDRDQGHKRAQDVRFSTVYQPGPNQLPSSAPGAHNIDPRMMPPPGSGHQWQQTPTTASGGQQYGLFMHQFVPPTPTLPLTYGDPQAPSLGMNQGNLNLGMHVNPTNNSSYLDPVTRDTTTYGGIGLQPPGSGRVRGHPLRLENNQISTDPTSNDTFDNDSRMYTDESDSTKDLGGISTWRSNEVEGPAIRNSQPFTQINSNPVMGGFGIANPSDMYYRRPDTSKASGYDDFLMDNTATTDYRNAPRPHGTAKQKHQTDMGRARAQVTPYPEPSVRRPGEDFDDPDKSTYMGYQTPPPTPYLSDAAAGPAIPMALPGHLLAGQTATLPDGRKVIVADVIAYAKGQTACRVHEIPEVSWPTFK